MASGQSGCTGLGPQNCLRCRSPLEGLSVLHQMFRFRWPEWRKLTPARQQEIAREAVAVLTPAEEAGQSAAYSMLGHKGDLMLVHFRDSFDDLNATRAATESHGLAGILGAGALFVSFGNRVGIV